MHQLIADTSPVASFLLTTDNNAIYANQFAAALFGFATPAEACEKYHSVFFPVVEGEPPFMLVELSDMRPGDKVQLEMNTISSSFEIIPCTIVLSCQKSQDPNHKGNLIALHIQDKRQQIESQMVFIDRINNLHKKELAQTLIHAKSQFLKRMNVDFRTPLNAIIGLADIQLLRKVPIAPEIENAFVDIRKASGTLTSLLEEIIDLSAIESDGPQKDQPYEFIPVLYQALSNSSAYRTEDGVKFNLMVEDSLYTTPIGDGPRVQHIITSLLSSAFRNTAQGEVSIKVTTKPGNQSPHKEADFIVSICVEDTSPGMTAQEIEHIFDSDDSYGWVGMHTTKEMVASLWGTMDVASTVGKGTRVLVDVPQGLHNAAPLGEVAAGLATHYNPISFSHKTLKEFQYESLYYGNVLIIDDVDTNTFVLEGLLKPYGLNITTAKTGSEALSLISKGLEYDLIFIDYLTNSQNQSTHSQTETIAAILAIGYTGPIIALTGNTLLHGEDYFLQHGFSAYIKKPISVIELDRHLMHFIKFKHDREVKKMNIQKYVPAQNVSPELLSFAIKDITRTLALLDPIMEKSTWSQEDYTNYTAGVHGMKSAMAYIYEMALSAEAKVLEFAGKNQDMTTIRERSTAFLDALRHILTAQQAAENPDKKAGDQSVLLVHLEKIVMACSVYNKRNIRTAVEALDKYTWDQHTAKMVETLKEALPHSEFDIIESTAQVFLDLYF